MKYKCLMCGYIYDPAEGDPENGIEPGTAWDTLNCWLFRFDPFVG